MYDRNLQPALAIIKAFEGLKDGDPSTVRLDPYLCPAGVWTIGWGHVVLDPSGKALKGKENKQRAREVYPFGLSVEEAETLLTDDVRKFAAGVFRAVRVPTNNNQFCALVSLSFNIGFRAFNRATLLTLVNRRLFERVPAQFMRWTKSNGKELPGLVRRRTAEVALWQQEDSA